MNLTDIFLDCMAISLGVLAFWFNRIIRIRRQKTRREMQNLIEDLAEIDRKYDQRERERDRLEGLQDPFDLPPR